MGKDENIFVASNEELGSTESIIINPRDYVSEKSRGDDQNKLRPNLSTRHIVMITLGNGIGMSLWLGTATSLIKGGPAALFICFCIVTSIGLCVSHAVGELSVAYPMSAPFAQWSVKFLDRAWAVTVGLDYWLVFVLNLAGEITAANTVVHFWPHTDKVPVGAWLTIFLVVMVLTNLFPVKIFGEVETIEALVKFSWVFVVIIACIVISARDHIGFHWWNVDPFINGFKGFLIVLATCGWSIGGIEFTAVVAPEARNAFKSVPTACKSIFFRLFTFYVIGSLVITISVSPHDPNLFGGTGTNASPFVVAFRNAGIIGLAHVMNVIILISVLSAGCAYIYGGARQLYGMANMGLVPKIFARTDSQGRPWYGMFSVIIVGGGLSYLNVSEKGSVVFGWFVDLTTLCYFVVWGSIFLCHIRFRRAWTAQGRDLRDLPWRSKICDYGSYYGLVWMILLIVDVFYFSVWPLHAKSSAQTFFANFISIILVALVYLCAKIYYRGRFYVKAMDVDLDAGYRVYTEDEMAKPPKLSLSSLKPKNLPKTVGRIIFD